MKIKIKLIILIIALFSPFLNYSAAVGDDLIPDLKGRWSGTAFLYADTKGFSPADRGINLIVTKQSGLDFCGNIETRDKGTIRKLEFTGFLDKQKRYIGIVTQEGNINIGHLITKNIMKVNLKFVDRNAEVAIFRLKKEKYSPN